MSLPPFLTISPPPVTPPTPARLAALYASTSAQRLSNPTGYTANVQWWSGVIQELSRNGWLGSTSASSISPGGGTHQRGKEDDDGRGHGKRSHGEERGMDGEVEDEGGLQGDSGDRLVLTVDETLLARLENGEGVRPRGIGGVIETLCNTIPPDLLPLSTYLASLTPVLAPPTLTSRFVAQPLWWALSQLNLFASSGEEKVEKEEVLWRRFGMRRRYVHIPLVQKSAQQIMNHLQDEPILSYSSTLFSLSTFRERFGEIAMPRGKKLPISGHRHVLSKRDIEVLIKWLARDQGVCVTDGEVVKMLEPDQIPADHPMTEADRGTLTIITTLKKVDEQITQVVEQIAECQRKAKIHLAKSQKSLAMSILRSKKALEQILEKRIATSEQLHKVLASIDQAKSDVEVMDAYESATKTLKGVLAHPSLDMDKVERTTEELAEVMASQEEVDSAIRIGGELAVDAGVRGGGGEDEEELEKELEGLVREEKEKERVEGEKRRKEEAMEREKELERERERQKELEREQEQGRAQISSSSQKTTETPSEQITNKTTGISTGVSASNEWTRRFEDAQQRDQEEKRRAEVERMRKEEKMLAAE